MTTQKLQTANAFNWVNYGKTAFKTALLSQPMVVGFEVSNSFILYATGVYTPTDCTYMVNHAMQAVGYGVTAAGVEYAIIRNQWGISWGDKGYINVLLSNT